MLYNIKLFFLSVYSYISSFWSAKDKIAQLETQYESLLKEHRAVLNSHNLEKERLQKEYIAESTKAWQFKEQLTSSLNLLNNKVTQLEQDKVRLQREADNIVEKKINALSLEMEKWKQEELDKALKEGNLRSRSILRGKNAEQYVPFSENFLAEFCPSDAKFIGAPIDYLIFKNASKVTDKEEAEVELVFCDVKTGKSQLNKVQRAIKAAVEAKRVRWKTLELKDIPTA